MLEWRQVPNERRSESFLICVEEASSGHSSSSAIHTPAARNAKPNMRRFFLAAALVEIVIATDTAATLTTVAGSGIKGYLVHTCFFSIRQSNS